VSQHLVRLAMTMKHRAFLVCFCIAAVTGLAAGAGNTIPLSGTVFIGEQGLDISATGVPANTNIVWYGTGGTVGSAPAAVVSVGDPSDFYVSPVLFSGRTGAWFTETGTSPAFFVQEPQISIRVFDVSAGFEITTSTVWVPKGDTIGFQVDNNVYIIATRPGSAGAPITIKIRGPDGVEYSAVDSFSLTNILISSPTYMTGPVWNTGGFANGNYTVWAESTGNDMNDNYPQEGKTMSARVTFLLQSVNPLITPTLTPTTRPTTLPTIATTRTTVPVTMETLPPATVPTTLPTTVPTTVLPTTTPGFGWAVAVTSLGAAALALARKG
jgi:hypothetical protein